MNSVDPPWKAEWEVSEPLARRLIDSQFPDLAPARIEPLGEGWDNLALRVNERFVFRFPRRALGAEVMESELAVLPKLAGVLDTPIPRLTHVGQPAEGYPCRFAGYVQLSGNTACAYDFDDQQRQRMLEPLARFLRQLHQHDEARARDWGAPHDKLGRTEMPRRSRQGREMLNQLAKQGVLDGPLCTTLSRYLEQLEADPPQPADGARRPRVLVHGDLYVRHLIVDDDGLLTGVIDWGDVHYGDPAIDLAAGYCYLLPSSLPEFLSHYLGNDEGVDDSTRQVALMRGIQHSSLLVNYGHEIGDDRLLKSARDSLGRLAVHVEEQA